MSALADIKAAIKTRMETITGVGTINTFERYDNNLNGLAQHYGSGGTLKGWHIRRVTTQVRELRAGTPSRKEVLHNFQIRGFMAIKDAAESEAAFDLIVEAMRPAFFADETLGGTVNTISFPDQAGIQLRDSGPVMFAGVLCHAARLDLRTRHFE